METAATKPSVSGTGLRISSGCSTLEEFTAVFRKYCTPNSIFFATKKPRTTGEELRFAVSLKDGKTIMKGSGKVIRSHQTEHNDYKRPGMVIEFTKLDTMGSILLEELNSHVKPLPPKEAGFDVATEVHGMPGEEESTFVPKGISDMPGVDDHTDVDPNEKQPERAPGSDHILPANPFGALAASSLESFVECTLIEEVTAVAPEVGAESASDEDDDDAHTSIGPAPTPPAVDNLESEMTQEAAPHQVSNVPRKPKLPGMPEASTRGDPTRQGLGPQLEEPTMVVRQPTGTPAPVRVPEPAAGPAAAAISAPAPAPAPAPMPGPALSPATPPEVEEAETLVKPTLPPDFTVPSPENLANAVMEPVPSPGPAPVPAPTGRVSTPVPLAGQNFPDFVPGTVPLPQQPPEPVPTVSRTIAGLIGVICLAAGVMIGLLVGGGEPSPSAKADEVSVEDPPEIGDKANTAVVPDEADAAPAAEDPEPAVEPVAEPADAGVEAVPEEPVAAIEAVPEPGKGECALTLAVLPEDAEISIGGKKLEPGTTRVNLPCGVRPLQIVHAKFRNHKGKIALKKGEVTELNHQLKRMQVWIRINSVPKGALVSLNAEDVGRTPLKHRVPAYEPMELKMVRSGFKPLTHTIDPGAGETFKFKMKKRRRKKRAKKRKRPTL